MIFLVVLLRDEEEKQNAYRQNGEQKVDKQISKQNKDKQNWAWNRVHQRTKDTIGYGYRQVFCNGVVGKQKQNVQDNVRDRNFFLLEKTHRQALLGKKSWVFSIITL